MSATGPLSSEPSPRAVLDAFDYETNVWNDVSRQTSELVYFLISPIVTLIPGYYFGRPGHI